jgi:hypothetical protein
VRAAFEIHFQAGPLQSYIYAAENFGAAMKPNFEIERGPSQRPRIRRFDFPVCSYAFLPRLLLEHHRLILFFFRDASSRAAARELTAGNPIHRAGPALRELAPRPSSKKTQDSSGVELLRYLK